MTVNASVLFPEPFGPMIACTSPWRTMRSIPLRIGLPSTSTWRSLISRSGTLLSFSVPARHRESGLLARDEVREAHPVECLRDRRLQLHPHVMRGAPRLQRAVRDGLALGRTDLRLDRTFERAHDVSRGDLARIAREG